MTWSHRRGRMASMARLLDNVNYEEMTTEEICHETLAAQSIQRELLEADEANLLEEEDMYVFDCKPMVDLMHLVCCNKCKKPVKASQYSAHTERCRSLKCSKDILLELDGGAGHKKPPRKGRKKLQAAQENPDITTGDNGRYDFADKKGDSVSIGMSSVKDDSPASTNSSEVVMSPSEKRTKIEAAEHLLISEGLHKGHGVIANDGINCLNTSTYPPVPLATKMFYSQRNLRLRFALNHLYHEASIKDHCSEGSKLVQETVVLPSQVSSPKDLFHDPPSIELSRKKNNADSVITVQEPDQIVVRSSELCLGTSRRYTSPVDYANQCRDNNVSRSALSVGTGDVGKMKSRYLPTAYSYTGNSGSSLGNIQQPSGSVPVV